MRFLYTLEEASSGLVYTFCTCWYNFKGMVLLINLAFHLYQIRKRSECNSWGFASNSLHKREEGECGNGHDHNSCLVRSSDSSLRCL